MADSGVAGELAIIAAGIGGIAMSVFGAWFQAKRKSEEEGGSPAIVGGIMDSRSTRDMIDAVMRLERTITASDQDRRSEERESRECVRRLIDALDRNTEASRLDALPDSIREPLRRLERDT